MRRLAVVSLVAIVLLVVVSLARAQANGYTISWWTADGGGGTSADGSYTLSGTIGQPDAGQMTAGDYTLTGGFWGPAVAPGEGVYLPIIVR